MRYSPSAGFKHCYLVTVNRSESFKKNGAVKVKKRERGGGGGGEGVVVGRGGWRKVKGEKEREDIIRKT